MGGHEGGAKFLDPHTQKEFRKPRVGMLHHGNGVFQRGSQGRCCVAVGRCCSALFPLQGYQGTGADCRARTVSKPIPPSNDHGRFMLCTEQCGRLEFSGLVNAINQNGGQLHVYTAVLVPPSEEKELKGAPRSGEKRITILRVSLSNEYHNGGL